MDHFEQLKQIGVNIENVEFTVRKLNFTHPRYCGTCPREQSNSIMVDTMYLEIKTPKLWDKLNSLLDKDNFIFSVDDRLLQRPIQITKKYNKYDKYALYKRPGFDDAFRAMQVLKPALTECDFTFTCGLDLDCYEASDADLDLVTRELYRGDIDCISRNDGTIYIQNIPDIKYFTCEYVRIIIPITALPANVDLLTNIILTQK